VPADSFTHTAHSTASPEAILNALEEAATWRGVGPIDDVWGETAVDGRLDAFRWRARAAGRTWEGTARRIASEASSVALALDASEIAGTITVDIAPSDTGGSELTARLEARSKGVLAGMFWGVIADTLRSGLPGQVDEFAAGF
jgi:hypothetical protein